MEAAYDNSGRVENASQLVADYIADAADYRHQMADFIEFGQVYGKMERNQLDLFWPDKNKTAPLVMFIHGGYWQRLDRSAFSHMAKGLNARGVAVAIPSYTLCPDINISGIIDELRRACIILWKTYDRPITVIGHSAGGHLAACMLATKWNRIHSVLPEELVQSALSISGIFDLAPLMKTSINNALKLEQEEARSASPYNWMIEPGLRFDAWAGALESSEFHRQSRSQAQRWRMMGAFTRYNEIAGANHFTAIHPLTDPNSEMVNRILDLMKPAELPTLESLNIPEFKPKPVNEQEDTASSAMPVKAPGSSKADKPIVDDHQSDTPEASETGEAGEKSPEENKKASPVVRETTPETTKPDIDETTPTSKKTQSRSTVDMTSPIGMVQSGPVVTSNTDTADQEPTAEIAAAEADDDKLDIALAAALEGETKDVSKDEPAATGEPLSEAEAQSEVEPQAPRQSDEEAEDSPKPQDAQDAPNTVETSQIPAALEADADDLTIISGIGKVLSTRLADLGFTTFEQMADLSEPQKEMIEDILNFKGRIEREHWITQARHQKAIKELAASDQ